jgi:Glycoside-hydrolase family GH114
MAAVASQNGLSIGLKNAIDIIDTVSDSVQFAVNEECQANSECNGYNNFLTSGKPVFHIEYSAGASAACNEPRLTTVVKNLSLDGWVQYCDGSQYTTPTSGQSKRGKNGQ